MTTARTASWPAITARRWRKCSSTSRAAAARLTATRSRATGSSATETGATARRRHERPRVAPPPLGPSHRRDDPALLVSLVVVLAAANGIAVLAGPAGHHLGLPANLYRAERQFLRPRRRHADRRRHPVGHPVARTAR